MSLSGLFNINKQITFYGAYHSQSVNVLIHLVFVPVLLWTFQVMASQLPVPSFIPPVHLVLNEYLTFDLNWSAIHAGIYLLYYFLLEPTAALLYVPQMTLSLLTATTFSYKPDALTTAALVHLGSWAAQFAGHYLAEGRQPALIDNLIEVSPATLLLLRVSAHALGYKPALRKSIQADTAAEIARVKAAKAGSPAKKEL
ncbi:putative endoplasmic reticulum membrane protein C16E8.02 [Grifola frondosa]|uniref:Putative endoplasmic reticulum membrane protein C16E8.02 n=1 Tax=Grifola frondosa TaxID=5627 RepID=A0A1C7MHR4_GRIFR|nr:putative endoplasmic reticulum membrane protein C16E8.02 [Grifola frondosa]